MYKLENWSIGTNADAYTAPELITPALFGEVYGNPKFEDGELVRVSRVIKVEGRVVTTRNSVYKLGKIDKNYRKYLKKTNPDWDYRKPLDFKGTKC